MIDSKVLLEHLVCLRHARKSTSALSCQVAFLMFSWNCFSAQWEQKHILPHCNQAHTEGEAVVKCGSQVPRQFRTLSLDQTLDFQISSIVSWWLRRSLPSCTLCLSKTKTRKRMLAVSMLWIKRLLPVWAGQELPYTFFHPAWRAWWVAGSCLSPLFSRAAISHVNLAAVL